VYAIVCNVTAEVLASIDHAPSLLEQQVTSAVRWTESVERLHGLGVDRWLEFGSGKVLTGLAGRILDAPDALPVYDAATLEEAL
jgi:[acyl-carrier-protein] S-malonyltransferase